MAWEEIIRAPPPRPWMKRAATNSSMDGAKPHSTEPPMNRTMPVRYRGLRPTTSPSLPVTGMASVWAMV